MRLAAASRAAAPPALRGLVGEHSAPGRPWAAVAAAIAPESFGQAAASAAGHRHFSTGGGKNRFNAVQRRAAEQHKDYLRQLGGPKIRRIEPIQVDPKVRKFEQGTLERLQQPVNPLEVQAANQDLGYSDVPSAEEAERLYEVDPFDPQGRAKYGPFGRLAVWQGDIFKMAADGIILPMTANLLPYRGLSLEAFDQHGEKAVEDAFRVATQMLKEAKEQRSLQVGDVLVIEGRKFSSNEGTDALDAPLRGEWSTNLKAQQVILVIMPWFWQGSQLDAAKRLRFCIKRALAEAAKTCASVAVPNLGAGVFGYEPRNCSQVIAEESMEALLDIDSPSPTYRLREVQMVDMREEAAEDFRESMSRVTQRWMPEMRVTSSAQYFGRQSRRLLLLPATPNFFWNRWPVKFKRNHGVVRKQRRHYLGNVKSRLWRPHRVHQPPPFMLNASTGVAADAKNQRAARPHYVHGVSHWLFPVVQSGFHGIRVSSKGGWVAKPRDAQIGPHVRPRL